MKLRQPKSSGPTYVSGGIMSVLRKANYVRPSFTADFRLLPSYAPDVATFIESPQSLQNSSQQAESLQNVRNIDIEELNSPPESFKSDLPRAISRVGRANEFDYSEVRNQIQTAMKKAGATTKKVRRMVDVVIRELGTVAGNRMGFIDRLGILEERHSKYADTVYGDESKPRMKSKHREKYDVIRKIPSLGQKRQFPRLRSNCVAAWNHTKTGAMAQIAIAEVELGGEKDVVELKSDVDLAALNSDAHQGGRSRVTDPEHRNDTTTDAADQEYVLLLGGWGLYSTIFLFCITRTPRFYPCRILVIPWGFITFPNLSRCFYSATVGPFSRCTVRHFYAHLP